jgi:hydroxymethylpyrimidine pyrophosphatase-like HAD family hydrolase
MMKRGTLAFDMDGTLTEEATSIPQLVIESLEKWSQDWHIAIITGRPFSYAKKALDQLKFPFSLAVQNGADIIDMPKGKKQASHHLKHAFLNELDTIYQDFEESFLIYGGFDQSDVCYYRPGLFSDKMLAYLESLEKKTGLNSEPIENLEQLKDGGIALVKCVGPREMLHQIGKRIASFQGVNGFQIKDPLFPEYDLLVITSDEANKGKAANWLLNHGGFTRPLIVSGDDNNDIPMMKVADYAVAIGTEQCPVRPFADVCIPFGEGKGLIEAVEGGMNATAKDA